MNLKSEVKRIAELLGLQGWKITITIDRKASVDKENIETEYRRAKFIFAHPIKSEDVKHAVLHVPMDRIRELVRSLIKNRKNKGELEDIYMKIENEVITQIERGWQKSEGEKK